MIPPPPSPSLLEALGGVALALASMLGYFSLREFGRGGLGVGGFRVWRRRGKAKRRDDEG